MDTTLQPSLLNSPAEVILDIIPQIEYTPWGLRSFCLTCTKLNALIKQHEHSLVSAILENQYLKNSKAAMFPGLAPKTFEQLAILYRRHDSLEELHRQWLIIVNNGFDLLWMRGRWEAIHRAGLLLLYRLHDTGSYIGKVELLHSLPATSLACLLFKLIASVKILRIYGPEPINQSFRRNDELARSDIELAFEELLLEHGPEFFDTLLQSRNNKKLSWAIRYIPSSHLYHLLTHIPTDYFLRGAKTSTLHAEVDNMFARQQPFANGDAKPPTLISSLRRALAARADVDLAYIVDEMWDLLSGTAFDDVDDAKLVRIVAGEAIPRGKPREGF